MLLSALSGTSQVKEGLTFSTGKAEDPFQKLQLQIIGAVAQFERAMIRERQREGIAIAKAAGKYKGRKPSFTPEQQNSLARWSLMGSAKQKHIDDMALPHDLSVPLGWGALLP